LRNLTLIKAARRRRELSDRRPKEGPDRSTASIEALSDPTDAALYLIDGCLRHGSVQLTGKADEPDGHWRASLRETRGP